MKNTCCVPHCESKRSSVKLHRFPKTEIGLKKWLQNCINGAGLNKFSSEKLHTMFVCHKHFEKRFVTAKSRLRQSAYPTLFSLKEINSGIPISGRDNSENLNILLDHNYRQTVRRKHDDHSYCKPKSPLKEFLAQENIVSFSNTIQAAIQGIYQNDEILQIKQLIDMNVPSTSKPVMESADDRFKHNILSETSILQCKTVNKVSKSPYVNRKKLSPMSLKLLSEYNKVKRQLRFATRPRKAKKFSKMGLFEKLTAHLNPLAKKILWMQISQATKQTKGRRFSDDDKLIALSIMKQSPRTYKLLRRIFILPSVRTINKMITKLKVDSGINTAYLML